MGKEEDKKEGYEVSEEKIKEVLESEEFIKDYYLKRDELLFNAKLSQGQNFSKYTFATSAVALSASLTLIKLFHSPTLTVFLGVAWFLFSLAIISSLLSILASMDAMDRQAEQLIGREPPPSIGRYVEIFNFLSLILIAIGLLFVLSFSYANFIRSGGMEKKSKKAEMLVKKSDNLSYRLKDTEDAKIVTESVKPLSLLIKPAQPSQSQNQDQSQSSNSTNQK
jgi:uncharacterized membrane protein YqhA